MEWIKVKVKHAEYDYADFSDCEFRAWIKIMCLTAIIERDPTDIELSRHIHHKTLKSLQRKLKDGSRNGQGTLKDITRKVLEDVEYTHHLKVKNRSRMAEYRHKKAVCNVLPVTATEHVTLQGKIRVDKSRVDKIREDIYNDTNYDQDKDNVKDYDHSKFEEFWSLYPKPIGLSMALLTFRATVKTDEDFEDLKTALKNYLASKEVKDGYIKNGSNWIEDWRGWLTLHTTHKKRAFEPIPVKLQDVFKGGAKEDIDNVLKKRST